MRRKIVTVRIEDLGYLAPIPILQCYYRLLVERCGKDSFEARFYLKYADSWYPKDWTQEQLEAGLTTEGHTWSQKIQEAFVAEEEPVGKRETKNLSS